MACEILYMLRRWTRNIRVPVFAGSDTRGILLLLALHSAPTQAVSFSADVVQVKGDELVHARVFWLDGRVRFEYLDQGVQMAQIFDAKNKRMIWLDTEKKVYIQHETKQASLEQQQQVVRPADDQPYSPCDSYKLAQCIKLKSAEINQRNTDKWLITFNVDGRDEHMFQWIDIRHRIPIRQENPDGSILDAHIIDDIEVEGREAFKVEMLSIAPDGGRSTRIQWYDSELNVVIRQQDDNGTVEELRNIRLEPVSEDKFVIPEGYEAFDTRLSASGNGSSITFISQ